MSQAIAYLNGQYQPLSQTKISVLDRGFLFGDGVYEVIPVYNRQVFRMQEHMQRLNKSLEGVSIVNPLSDEEWQHIFDTLIAKTPSEDQAIYLQITRGTMQKRLHSWDDTIKPNVFIMSSETEYPNQDINTAGAKAITLDDIRWDFCHLKTINLLPNALLRQKAIEKQATEAILIRDGKAIEGAASNLFIVKDDILTTPAKSHYLLGGITRDLIIELCQKNKILVRETDISEDELHDADEIWITSSTKEIVPITTLNQHAVGKGKPGALWQTMIQLYQEYKQSIRQP